QSSGERIKQWRGFSSVSPRKTTLVGGLNPRFLSKAGQGSRGIGTGYALTFNKPFKPFADGLFDRTRPVAEFCFCLRAVERGGAQSEQDAFAGRGRALLGHARDGISIQAGCQRERRRDGALRHLAAR